MTQDFDTHRSLHVYHDEKRKPVGVLHVEVPYIPKATTPQAAATEYLEKFGDVLGISSEQLRSTGRSPSHTPEEDHVEYRFVDERTLFDTTTVVFAQTIFGLPIYGAGVTVNLRSSPLQVISAQSTLHTDVRAAVPPEKAADRLRALEADTLSAHLGLAHDVEIFDAKSLKILNKKLIVYRYEKRERLKPREPGREEPTTPNPPLPPVPEEIEEGRHYVAAEIVFILPTRHIPDLRWIAIVDVRTFAILRLRPLIDDVNGLVFAEDPITDNGGPAASAGNALLNPVRRSVLLKELAPPVAGRYALSGDLVQLADVEAPAVAPPTEPIGTDFNFDARTNEFAAVNAYYHCDRFFRLVRDLGFDTSQYFVGTSFPSIVDHRGRIVNPLGIEINAHCLGTGSFGILRTTFMLADLTNVANPIGLACDFRVALHELGGHGILYNYVNSPNFGFAHSAGDSFGAVLCDPDSNAADRFETFPWVPLIARRHDRPVTGGWAWGGVQDVGGYSSEQILCTTHFRIYRAIGGDSTELAMRKFASLHLPYLILRAVAGLTPATNPPNALGFALAEMAAAMGNWTSEDELGGYYWKVVRWGYEKQGLFQPAGAPSPVVSAGAPPPVDVYIDDGRGGEYYYGPGNEFGTNNIYPYLQRFWETTEIWNRLEPDGAPHHQTPRVGKVNYAYVKVRNRGTQAATNVSVNAYHSRPAAGLVWPDDWKPMTTASLPVPGAINPGGEVLVGPFEWRAEHEDHDCMLMSVSAAGDLANNNTASLLPCSLGPAPLWQLVPCDNNLGLRAVIPVPGGGRRRGLLAAFRERRFWAANPLRDSAKMEIRAITPSFLSSRGWSMRFDNAGGSSFTLGSHDSREIRPRLVAGQSFSKADVMAAGTVSIVIVALANGLVVGGLTYILDPYLEWPPHLREEEERHQFAHNEREHERGEEHKEEGRDRRRKVKFEIDLDS